jgi:hypothetical protein
MKAPGFSCRGFYRIGKPVVMAVVRALVMPRQSKAFR